MELSGPFQALGFCCPSWEMLREARLNGSILKCRVNIPSQNLESKHQVQPKSGARNPGSNVNPIEASSQKVTSECRIKMSSPTKTSSQKSRVKMSALFSTPTEPELTSCTPQTPHSAAAVDSVHFAHCSRDGCRICRGLREETVQAIPMLIRNLNRPVDEQSP